MIRVEEFWSSKVEEFSAPLSGTDPPLAEGVLEIGENYIICKCIKERL